MRKTKLTRGKISAIISTAMALTLAMPANFCINTNAAEASVLGSALVTYDFEGGTASIKREGEKYLKLVDGKPVIENNQYVMETSTALPEVKEDSEKGKVLEFKDSVKIDKYVKTEADATAAAKAEGVDVVTKAALNKEYPAGSYIQQKERIGGRVKLDNPFTGMTFDETKENAGVSISYWVKVPVIKVHEITGEKLTDGTGKDRGANSTTIVFNNAGRRVMNKDDHVKNMACVGYDEAVKNKDEAALKDYDMGTQKIVWDKDGNAYVMYENYGKLIRFNPNYPDETASGQAAEAVAGTTGVAKKGGWYAREKGISVEDADGNKYKISSLYNEGSKIEDRNQYELFRYRYADKDDKANGYSTESKVREEAIEGSLQISTDNDFHFMEDNYREESYTDANNQTKNKAVDGARVTNPNTDRYDIIEKFRQANHFVFDGDEFVTNLQDGAEEWHYVTIVIQNDWVVTYVDGKEADPELDYGYMKEMPGNSESTDFGKNNTEKMFNRGKGLRGIFGHGDSNVGKWPEDGTASTTPANSIGITMLDWIAHEGTELYLGGTGYASEAMDQGYGTIEGVCLDDVSFFGTALSSEEAVALYNEVAGNINKDINTASLGDIDGNGAVELSDAQKTLKAALMIEKLDETQTKAADVDGNGTVELSDAQKILKVALKIESF